MPPASPAAIMFVNSGSKVFGCLRIASASEAPPSTSARVCRMTAGEVLVLFLGAENLEALHQRQAGVDHHRELPREHREVLRRDLLPELPGLRLGRGGRRLLLGRGNPRDENLLTPERGDGRVHRVGTALTADRLSRPRPSRVCESRHVLPQNQNSQFQIPNSKFQDFTTAGRGTPGRGPIPAPGTTPAPRLIMSWSSSFNDDAASAVSSVISRFM